MSTVFVERKNNDNKKHDVYLFLFHERYGRGTRRQTGSPSDPPPSPPPLPPSWRGGGGRSAPWVTFASSSFTLQLKTWELSALSRHSVYLLYHTSSLISFDLCSLYVAWLYELIIFLILYIFLFSYIFCIRPFFLLPFLRVSVHIFFFFFLSFHFFLKAQQREMFFAIFSYLGWERISRFSKVEETSAFRVIPRILWSAKTLI